jgi:phosphoglycolate phosphatase
MFDLIVFDLDGTLIDSQKDIANAANALVAELGGARLSDDAIALMVGEGAALLVRRALAATSLDPETPGALDRFLELYDAAALDYTVPYDGMVQTLEHLGRTMRMSVLTNKPSRATDAILRGLDLRRYFLEVIGGDTTFQRKPDPAGLLHLADVSGTSPQRTLMVGDSPIDLATARHAGTPICLARYGFGYRFSPADFVGDELFIDTPSDLINLLESLHP